MLPGPITVGRQSGVAGNWNNIVETVDWVYSAKWTDGVCDIRDMFLADWRQGAASAYVLKSSEGKQTQLGTLQLRR